MKQSGILFLLLLYAIAAFSQGEQSNKNFLTFSAGLASYTIFGSQVDLEASYPGSSPKINRRNGFRIDFGYKRLLSKGLFLNTGISALQKGGSQTGTGFVDYARLEKTYFQIPLLIGVQGAGNKTKLGIETGASINLEIASGNSTTGFGWTGNSFKSNTFIPSFIAATFLETKLSDKNYLNIRLLYEIDLMPTIERTDVANKPFQIKTQGLSVTLGLTKAL